MAAPSEDSGGDRSVTYPLPLARSAAMAGGVTGAAGLVLGSISGVLRTTTPVVFAILSGLQCAAIGTTFWGTRSVLLQRDGLSNWWALTRGLPPKPRHDLDPTPRDRVLASTVAGTTTGVVLGPVFRGVSNIIPGAIMWSIFGFVGQHAYNALDARQYRKALEAQARAEENKEPENWMQRLAKKKWSPMTVISDDEYVNILSEKLLKIETDIALIDDRIAELREEQKKAKPPSPGANDDQAQAK